MNNFDRAISAIDNAIQKKNEKAAEEAKIQKEKELEDIRGLCAEIKTRIDDMNQKYKGFTELAKIFAHSYSKGMDLYGLLRFCLSRCQVNKHGEHYFSKDGGRYVFSENGFYFVKQFNCRETLIIGFYNNQVKITMDNMDVCKRLSSCSLCLEQLDFISYALMCYDWRLEEVYEDMKSIFKMKFDYEYVSDAESKEETADADKSESKADDGEKEPNAAKHDTDTYYRGDEEEKKGMTLLDIGVIVSIAAFVLYGIYYFATA